MLAVFCASLSAMAIQSCGSTGIPVQPVEDDWFICAICAITSSFSLKRRMMRAVPLTGAVFVVFYRMKVGKFVILYVFYVPINLKQYIWFKNTKWTTSLILFTWSTHSSTPASTHSITINIICWQFLHSLSTHPHIHPLLHPLFNSFSHRSTYSSTHTLT